MLQFIIGTALSLAAWLICRAVAHAWRPRRPLAWALDATIALLIYAGWVAVFARPIAAGVLTFALIGGFAFADFGKRAVLKEPVVFTDWSEFLVLVRHPHLYLPFVGPVRVLAGQLAALSALLLLVWLEPPVWWWRWWAAPLALGAWVLVIVASATVFLRPLAAMLSGFSATGDPVVDSASLGPLAMQFVHGMPTRRARPALRSTRPVPSSLRAASDEEARPRPPIVLVQSESFFDVRRLHADAAVFVPNFAQLCRQAVRHGRFEAPAWGANTTRTEFEVLSGEPLHAIGLDRFNPYNAFARRPVASLAWRLRAAGYRTVCIHLYDPSFYGRTEVIPALGFERFISERELKGAPRTRRYIDDLAASKLCVALLAEPDPRPLFAFIITMGNHGPWTRPTQRFRETAGALPPALARSESLQAYVEGVQASDRMIPPLTAALADKGDGVLAVYGDHVPSLTNLGLAPESSDTDYVIWRAKRTDMAPPPSRLAAWRLGHELLAAAGLV